MADVSDKIAALEAALASGELTVESDGDRVTYRSVEQLMGALSYFRSQLPASPVSGQPAFGFSAVGYDRT